MKRIINKRNIALALLGLSLPLAAFAQSSSQVNTILENIVDTLNIVLILAFALLTLYFIWGVIQYVSAAGDEEKINQGKKHMLWGIIGMAVVAAAWALANLLLNYIGTKQGTGPKIPQF